MEGCATANVCVSPFQQKRRVECEKGEDMRMGSFLMQDELGGRLGLDL